MALAHYTIDPRALAAYRRFLWTKRAAIGVAMLAVVLLVASRLGPLEEQHFIGAGAFLAIFIGGKRRAIAEEMERLRSFELWLDDDQLRASTLANPIARADIVSVASKSAGLVLTTKSGTLLIPRQVERFEEVAKKFGR